MYIKVIAILAVIGFIFLVVNRAIARFKYFNKVLINLGLCVFIDGFFCASYYIDKINNLLNDERALIYVLFVLITIFYTLSVIIINIIKAIKARKNGYYHTKTVIDKKDYLYLVFENRLNVYLKKKDYSGYIYKLKSRDYHDETVCKISKSLGVYVTNDDFRKIGEYRIVGEKDIVYHCYLVSINDDIKDDKFTTIDKRQLATLDLKKMDKQIVFRTILKEPFEIRINKKDLGE